MNTVYTRITPSTATEKVALTGTLLHWSSSFLTLVHVDSDRVSTTKGTTITGNLGLNKVGAWHPSSKQVGPGPFHGYG